jgi:hypothetical protein
MGGNKSGEHSGRCFICGKADSATIEFDRPVMLLCECEGCGKFFLKDSTQKQLAGEPDFESSRNAISRLIKAYYKRHNRPLEIIRNGEVPRTGFSMRMEDLLTHAKSDKF